MKAGKISYTGVGVAAGGAIGFLGVAVGWFSYSVPFAGGTVTVSLSGTADWTGTAALIGAIAVQACCMRGSTWPKAPPPWLKPMRSRG